jgi:hypothetical protein
MAIGNVFVEPGVYSQFQPTTVLPVLPGGPRVVALIGTGRTTNLVNGETVTKGAIDTADDLAHLALAGFGSFAAGGTITDANFVTYNLGVDYQLGTGGNLGDVDWGLSGAALISGTIVGPYAGLSGKTLILAVAGGANQSYTFTTETTAAQVVATINTNFVGVVADDTTAPGAVTIKTSAVNNTSLLIGNGTSDSILGFTAGSFVQSPREPLAGVSYTVSYQYTKAASDYTPVFYFDMNDVITAYGAIGSTDSLQPNTLGNILTIPVAANLVFQQGASVICVIQCNPADGAFITQCRNGLTKLLGVEGINIVVPLSTDPMLFADVENHVNLASSITERKERTAILGMAGSPSVASVVSQAQALVDKRVVLAYPTAPTAILGTNPSASTLDGSFLAAALGGIRTSVQFDVADPLTKKEVVGFQTIPNNNLRAENNQLASNGVCVITTSSSIPRVYFGTTTDPSRVDTREYSVVEIIDYTAVSVRQLLEAIFVGQKILGGTPSQVRSTISAILTNLVNIQIITAFQNITAVVDSVDPTQIDVSFQISPVFPLNYILITFSLNTQG